MIAKFCDCAHFLWIFLIFRTKVPVDASKEREGERDINDMDSDLHSWILMFADGTKIQRSQG